MDEFFCCTNNLKYFAKQLEKLKVNTGHLNVVHLIYFIYTLNDYPTSQLV